jgi:hypothetical protein
VLGSCVSLGERKDHRYWSWSWVQVLVLPYAIYITLARSLQQSGLQLIGIIVVLEFNKVIYEVLALHMIGVLQMIAVTSDGDSNRTSSRSGNVNIIICSNKLKH